MKKFESAEIEIVYFNVPDIICTSGQEGLIIEEIGGKDDSEGFGTLF